jgi:hypothetical protein
MAKQAVLVRASEFHKTEVPRGTPILIHFSKDEFERLTKGMKPQPGLAHQGSGLQVIPLPGQPGYVAFPVCGPDEVPVVDRHGGVHCVHSDFEDTTEPRTPIPGTGCSWTLDERARFVCTGTCQGGMRCARRFQLLPFGFFIGCRCPRRPIAAIGGM